MKWQNARGAFLPPGEIYCHSYVPYGYYGTYYILIGVIAIISVGIGTIYEIFYPEWDYIYLFAILLFIMDLGLLFVLPFLFNYISSPFEKNRIMINSFNGYEYTSWFMRAGQFCRLIIYEDGIELRVIFNFYFIPYDKMTRPKMSNAIYWIGIPIESDLPGIPKYFRFWSYKVGRIYDLLVINQSSYLKNLKNKRPDSEQEK